MRHRTLKIREMKKNKSVTKKIVSMTAGGVLLASLYANAVYVPQNNRAVERELDRQQQTIQAGQVEFVDGADGFKVTERPVTLAADEVAELEKAIEKLEVQLAESEEVAMPEGGVVRAAYSSREVKQTAQTAEELAEAARQISAITGLPLGATIGRLALIIADPLYSAGALKVISASAQPGGLAAATSSGGGISSQGTAVLALFGVQSAGGVAGGAAGGAAAGLVGASAGATAASSSP